MAEPDGMRVVITGASSGIGRATARAFAGRGARLVLAARRAGALGEVARECEALGGRALAVPTDVTDPGAVATLARRAAGAFGGIDVWINNAGVGAFGPFAPDNLALQRRVVETNLFGAMHGAAAVLPYFLAQGRGVLITNVSIGGLAPVPFASGYTASKFGLRGFHASLRQELADHPGIRVCAVFPASIDTPAYGRGANVSGRVLKPGPPVYPPERVAQTLLSLALHPRDEVAVGWPSTAARLAYGLAPGPTERALGAGLRLYLRQADPAPQTGGNLFGPVDGVTAVSGGWRVEPGPGRAVGRAALASLAALGVAVLAARLRGSRGDG